MPKQFQGPVALIALAIAIGIGLVQLFWPGAEDTTTAPMSQSGATSPTPDDQRPARSHPDGPVVQAPQETAYARQLPSAARNSAELSSAPGDFAYYVLALSWSPTYCLEEADPQRDRRQCQAPRPYAFVLHGLWPQHERGYPKDCQSDTPRVPDPLVDSMLDIMPSRGLVGHEWRQHGACTGLSQDAYFQASRAAYAAIRIPAVYTNVTTYLTTSPSQIEAAFLKANPEIKPDALTVSCSRKHLREVRICMTKDFKFRSCGSDLQRDCDLAQIIMPPARGGR